MDSSAKSLIWRVSSSKILQLYTRDYFKINYTTQPTNTQIGKKKRIELKGRKKPMFYF